MLTRTRVAAGLAMLCLSVSGCRSAMNCTDGCARGSALAGMRYDCTCESGCSNCAPASTACGTTCDRPNCTDGCGTSCANDCGAGCRRPVLDRLCGCTGCGELYWCEWYNSPPQLCQPCDCHGNYTGPGVDRYILPNASGRSGTPVGDDAPWLMRGAR